MSAAKVKKFMELAGQETAAKVHFGTPETRKLGAQLLLSEVLEYVIRGLGVTPVIDGVRISDPESLRYEVEDQSPDKLEMIDGLADVAYTMHWNAHAFGVPLEESFDLVCDNNLGKFVELAHWSGGEGDLPKSEWHCSAGVVWPPEVVRVEVLEVGGEFFAVGKDSRGKVRKPSTYKPVDLTHLVVE